MSEQQQQTKKEVMVDFPKELMGGVYSNTVLIRHTKEEFIMDFLMVTPDRGIVTARVIVSPGHMKRYITALQENAKKYENKFGRIAEAPPPPPGKIGYLK